MVELIPAAGSHLSVAAFCISLLPCSPWVSLLPCSLLDSSLLCNSWHCPEHLQLQVPPLPSAPGLQSPFQLLGLFSPLQLIVHGSLHPLGLLLLWVLPSLLHSHFPSPGLRSFNSASKSPPSLHPPGYPSPLQYPSLPSPSHSLGSPCPMHPPGSPFSLQYSRSPFSLAVSKPPLSRACPKSALQPLRILPPSNPTASSSSYASSRDASPLLGILSTPRKPVFSASPAPSAFLGAPPSLCPLPTSPGSGSHPPAVPAYLRPGRAARGPGPLWRGGPRSRLICGPLGFDMRSDVSSD